MCISFHLDRWEMVRDSKEDWIQYTHTQMFREKKLKKNSQSIFRYTYSARSYVFFKNWVNPKHLNKNWKKKKSKKKHCALLLFIDVCTLLMEKHTQRKICVKNELKWNFVRLSKESKKSKWKKKWKIKKTKNNNQLRTWKSEACIQNLWLYFFNC